MSRNKQDNGYAYRVFVSYPHEKAAQDFVKRLRQHLVEHLGLNFVYDAQITVGNPFHEEIRAMISTAHLFIPVITPEAATRPWVNQEIGYALGLGVPMIPIAIGDLPSGMAEAVQAVVLEDAGADLTDVLSRADVEVQIRTAQRKMMASHKCLIGLYARTAQLVKKADELALRHGFQKVRQRSAFGSLSIPDAPARAAVWDVRERAQRRGLDVRERLREERQTMEAHAREAGCSLIIDPFVATEKTIGDHGKKEAAIVPKHEREGMILRLNLLKEFLESIPDDKVRIAVTKGQIEGSLVLLGDWFAVEAVVPQYAGGYRHSTYTEHGPTVLRIMEQFDSELSYHLQAQGVTPEDSRTHALAQIEGVLSQLQEKSS